MKLTLLAGGLALGALAGCADLTKWTGLTAEQQECIASAAVEALPGRWRDGRQGRRRRGGLRRRPHAVVETAIATATEAAE